MARSTATVHRDLDILDLARIGLPEVPVVGRYDLQRTWGEMDVHTHPGLLEICYLVHGEQIHHVDGRDYRLRGNDVFVSFPGEQHGSADRLMGKGLLYWLQIALPKRPKTFLTVTASESAPLIRRLRSLPRRFFHGRDELRKGFEAFYATASGPVWPLQRLKVATLLLDWLQQLVQCAQQAPAPQITPDIQGVIDSMDTRLGEDLSVGRMADRAGLSASRFKTKFKQQVGIAPREFFLRKRIDRAIHQLQTTALPITAIAMELGFSSSQYFATVFRRFTGRRPSEYRSS
jgi:AraC-like DNA-binding protein